MIEEVGMKYNRMKTKQNLQYIHSYLTENNTVEVMRKTIRRRQCWYMAVSYIAKCTQSAGNPIRSELGSVLVEM
jgi:hypothetical protein